MYLQRTMKQVQNARARGFIFCVPTVHTHLLEDHAPGDGKTLVSERCTCRLRWHKAREEQRLKVES